MPACQPTSSISPPNAIAFAAFGVAPGRIYVDHDLTGTNRERPDLHQALVACRAGTHSRNKARSAHALAPDARAIADVLTQRAVKINLGGSVHDPANPVGRLLFKSWR
ncbi:MAG: hypothetical protein QOK16_4818 [Solirubrobacteraceae bacterium]|jgi:hypothetical protein|nr:hypothetical protein [Solirubrobacteraceae bacterium]